VSLVLGGVWLSLGAWVLVQHTMEKIRWERSVRAKLDDVASELDAGRFSCPEEEARYHLYRAFTRTVPPNWSSCAHKIAKLLKALDEQLPRDSRHRARLTALRQTFDDGLDARLETVSMWLGASADGHDRMSRTMAFVDVRAVLDLRPDDVRARDLYERLR
jgi:hypothetical protein